MSGYAFSLHHDLTSGPEYTTDYHQNPNKYACTGHAFTHLIYMALLRFSINTLRTGDADLRF